MYPWGKNDLFASNTIYSIPLYDLKQYRKCVFDSYYAYCRLWINDFLHCLAGIYLLFWLEASQEKKYTFQRFFNWIKVQISSVRK